jgi:hypothetical protein
MTERLKTLTEIAAYFNRTPKTFAKIVRDNNVPHSLVGRSMLFDLNEVKAHLRARPVERVEVKYAPNVRKSGSRNKLADALGL